MKKIILLILIISFSNCIFHFNSQLNEMNNFAIKLASKDYWQEAIFWWEKILKEDPNNIKALNNLAVAYEKIGDYLKAKALYEKALSIEKNNIIEKNYKRCLKLIEKKELKIE